MAENYTPKKADEWRPVFLATLRNSANVRAACLAAGITRKAAYLSRDASAEFRRQWDEAIEEATDILEAAARKRAVESSDTLLIFLLKAHRPDKYGEKAKIEILIRQTAEQVAKQTGMSVEDVIAEAERIVSHA
jgi:hypothetical protein